MKQMPKGVSALYLIQAFSTFSYAILYSSLALFLTKQLNMPAEASSSIVSLFLAFNYVLQLLGGFLGGRFLSNRALFIISTGVELIGLFIMALVNPYLLNLSLSLFLIGCGLSFTAYNNMLTQRFKQEDYRRESAFILSYGSMSIGFFAGYIFSGFFDYTNQYQNLFYIAMITDFFSVFLLLANWSALADTLTPLMQINSTQGPLKNTLGILMALTAIPILHFCFDLADFSNNLVIIISLIMFTFVAALGLRQKSKEDRTRIFIYLILAFATVLFWMIFFTGPIGIILFIKNNVDRHLAGYEIATQWLLNINPFVIVACAPLLSSLVRKFNFSIALQFALGFMVLGISFCFLIGGVHFADERGYVALPWVFFYFVAQGMAELLIAPIGYAMIGRLAPTHLQGVLMGIWMLVAGVAASFSHFISGGMAKVPAGNPLLSNGSYLHVFEQLSLWSLFGAVGLFLIAGWMEQLMNQIRKLS